MNVLVIFTLICYTFGDITNHSPQLRARIEMNKDMFRSYSRNFNPGNIQLEITIPFGLAKLLGLKMANPKQDILRSSQPEESRQTWHRDLSTVPALANYLTKTTYLRLQSIIEKYYKRLISSPTHKDICPDINATFSSFKLNFQKHIDGLLEVDPINQIDKDLILLDIIDTSTSLLYEGTLICLKLLIDRNLAKGAADINTVTEEIFKKTLRKKKQDLILLCNMTGICRPFPGFSEYLIDLLDEVINLPDSKLHTVVMKSMVIVENKQSDIVHALGKELTKKLGKHLQLLVYDELSEIKRALTDKRRDILERYRWKKITERQKAYRILLDMVDKAFVTNKTDKVADHFIITIKALRNWKAGEMTDISEVITIFFSYVLKTFTDNWGDDIFGEARALLHIIIDGLTYNQHKYKYLLSEGSNYITL